MYGRSEIDLKFPTPIPVNITYQTAFVDDAGKLQIRKDIYGRDAAMIGLLKNSRSKDLETMVAHAAAELFTAERTVCRPASASPATTRFSSGPSFFERLFGGPSTVAAAGPCWPPAATAVHPVILPGRISEQNQRSRLTGDFVYVNHYPSRIRHRALFRHSQQVRLSPSLGAGR